MGTCMYFGMCCIEGARFRLRWFSPTTEVPLCGHATLASAAVLFYKKSKNDSHIIQYLTCKQVNGN